MAPHNRNLHRNNLAEWVMVVALLYPAWLGVTVWNGVRRFVPFVASWCKLKK